MTKFLKISFAIALAVLFQVAIFPAYLLDPFQPNLLIIIIAFLSLRETLPATWGVAFVTGLLQDCFSGIYLGLNGFGYVFVYLMLRGIRGVLYTDSRYLLMLVVFLATIITGLTQLFLLFLFSAGNGIYSVILPSLLPQALVNTLVASVVAPFTHRKTEEAA